MRNVLVTKLVHVKNVLIHVQVRVGSGQFAMSLIIFQIVSVPTDTLGIHLQVVSVSHLSKVICIFYNFVCLFNIKFFIRNS